MDSLSDDELRAEYRRASLMASICDNAGEVDAVTCFEATARACEHAMRERGLN